MTSQEILTKAIQKAIDGGWNFTYEADQPIEYEVLDGFDGDHRFFEVICRNKSIVELGVTQWDRWGFEQLFYRYHDFAKALWGEDWACEWHGHPMGNGDLFCRHDDGKGTVTSICGAAKSVVLQVWQYHLQQMVIADDPIKYLGENT